MNISSFVIEYYIVAIPNVQIFGVFKFVSHLENVTHLVVQRDFATMQKWEK